MSTWSLGPENGELTVRTWVAGRAARMGHRLTLVLESWSGTVRWEGDSPVEVTLTADLDSLRVADGEGGVTPLTGAEKGVARGNALKTLDSKTYPTVEFRSASVSPTEAGFRLHGPVSIHGVSKQVDVEVRVDHTGDTPRITSEVTVAQTDFGIRPFSMMMGAMKVADDVVVALSATAS